MDEMTLEFLFKDHGSGGGGCPAAYRTDRDTFVIQGWQLTERETAQLRQLAPDEAGVEIPANIVDQLVRARLDGRI
ncbi:hypothetical protein [Krasilnikovia sp. MM14-A1259]|uniref:hypothetical protein n=1 Tax=Krasilnikovia sp. MM14-A1259 TaxID=3373539 RepID=UPI00382DAEE1